jgi:hypothetical protein
MTMILNGAMSANTLTDDSAISKDVVSKKNSAVTQTQTNAETLFAATDRAPPPRRSHAGRQMLRLKE